MKGDVAIEEGEEGEGKFALLYVYPWKLNPWCAMINMIEV